MKIFALKADVLAQARRLVVPLAAVFVIAMGYGVVLPELPLRLARVLGADTRTAIARQTGLLTGAYMLALFVFAPLWGRLSDRVGRRPIVLSGLAGFGGALLGFAFSSGLTLAYAARTLAGVFAAAVVPVIFAWAGDVQGPRARARTFAWLYAASALGFLAGPALSAWLVSAEPSAVAGAGDRTALPLYAVAALSAAVWLASYRRFREHEVRRRAEIAAAPRSVRLFGLFALSLLVMFGLGSFEVALALQGQQVLALSARETGIMFAECSLVMILAQAFLLAPCLKRFGGALLVPALLAMAAGLLLLPLGGTYFMPLAVAVIAAASGLLIPALAYLLSLAAGTEQGGAFGTQTAVASLGQGVGSVTGGSLFALFPQAPFWASAGLLALGALAARGVSSRLGDAAHED